MGVATSGRAMFSAFSLASISPAMSSPLVLLSASTIEQLWRFRKRSHASCDGPELVPKMPSGVNILGLIPVRRIVMAGFGKTWLGLVGVAAVLAIDSFGEAQAFAAKEPSKLAPHRAIYEMSLDDARTASGITGIDGRMVFEFTGSECDDYSLNMRMVTQMTDSQGQTNLTDLRSSTWEQGDGTKFRFQSAQYLNDKLGDVTMGRAVRETPNEAVKGKLSQPSHAEIDLAGQGLFPTQHSLALIDAARTGQALFQARIYDGSEKGRKVYDTTAFIGTMVEPGADAKL